MHAVEEFPMPETFTQVCAFCRLVGHYKCFIKGFTHITRPLYDVLGKGVKMGPVQLPPKAQEAVRILKDKIQSTPVLVFLDFDKPFFLETEGLVLCCLRSRMIGATTLLHLGVAPSHHQRKTITALNLSSLPSSGASLNTLKSTLHMCHLWYRLTTIH